MSLSILTLFLAASSLLQSASSTPASHLPRDSSPITGFLLQSNFADPSIIEVDGTFYLFATGNGPTNVPMAKSSDMKNVDLISGDAMSQLPPWTPSKAPFVWAADVIQLPSGKFALYFSAASNDDTSKHCIGAATSDSVTGPYIPQNKPLACPIKQGGAIDAAGYVDGNDVYVVYKVDGNSLGGGGQCGNGDSSHPTPIMLQKVAADGFTPVGDAKQILDRGPGDGPLIEAPSLVKSGDTYVLFFSSNCYNGALYDTSYATASAIGGPYTKAAKPLLTTGLDNLNSPGGTEVLADGSRIVFHADAKPSDSSLRQLYTSPISIKGTTVSLGGS